VAGAQALVKGGKASIQLRCTGGACSGTLLLEVPSPSPTKPHAKRRLVGKSVLTIGRASFTIPAGGTEAVSVRLSAMGSLLLRKAGQRGLKVNLTGTGVTSRTLLLKGAKKSPRRRTQAQQVVALTIW
jgi:hypothetical protein